MSLDIKQFFLYINQVSEYDILTSNIDLIKKLKNLPTEKVVDVNNRMLDAIAYDVYGDESLWWVLLYYNSIVDGITVDEKNQISIPNRAAVESLLIDFKKK